MILIVRARHEKSADGNISAVELDGQGYEDKNVFRFTSSGMDFGDQRRPRPRFCPADHPKSAEPSPAAFRLYGDVLKDNVRSLGYPGV
jgi:hypothetical protein